MVASASSVSSSSGPLSVLRSLVGAIPSLSTLLGTLGLKAPSATFDVHTFTLPIAIDSTCTYTLAVKQAHSVTLAINQHHTVTLRI